MAGVKKTVKGAADEAANTEEARLADIERQASEEGHAGVINLPFQALKITSLGAVFHRCGRAFTLVPTVIPVDDLTADEQQRLLSEPRLRVREVTINVEDIDPLE